MAGCAGHRSIMSSWRNPELRTTPRSAKARADSQIYAVPDRRQQERVGRTIVRKNRNMEKSFQRFSELFAQLGLRADVASIRNFIVHHSPLAAAMKHRGCELLDRRAGAPAG